MENRVDTLLVQPFQNGAATGGIGQQQVIEVGVVRAAGRDDGPPDEAALFERRERVVIRVPDRQACRGNGVGLTKLRPQERRGDLARLERRSEVLPGVFVHVAAKKSAAIGPFFPDGFCAVDKRRIVDEQGATLAGHHILGLVKTERRQLPGGSERTAVPCGQNALRRILDDDQLPWRRDRAKRDTVASDARVVHRHYRPRSRGDGRLDQPLVQIQRIRPDVDEHGRRAAQHERIRGRDERERRQNHLVSGLDAGKDRGHLQRARTRVRQQRPPASKALLEPGLTACGEPAIAGKVTGGHRLAQVVVLPPRHVRSIERNGTASHAHP